MLEVVSGCLLRVSIKAIVGFLAFHDQDGIAKDIDLSQLTLLKRVRRSLFKQGGVKVDHHHHHGWRGVALSTFNHSGTS